MVERGGRLDGELFVFLPMQSAHIIFRVNYTMGKHNTYAKNDTSAVNVEPSVECHIILV